MSLTKRVWFEQDSLYTDVRDRYQAEGMKYREQFKFRIPLLRRGSAGRPYWEPAWPYCVDAAVKELELETIQLNSGLYFRSQDDLDRARTAAEVRFAQLDTQ